MAQVLAVIVHRQYHILIPVLAHLAEDPSGASEHLISELPLPPNKKEAYVNDLTPGLELSYLTD